MKYAMAATILCLGFFNFAQAEQIDQSREAVVKMVVQFSAGQINPEDFTEVVTGSGEKVYRFVGPKGAEVTLYGSAAQVSRVEFLINLQKQDIRESLTLITSATSSMTRSVESAKWIMTAVDQLESEAGGTLENVLNGKKIKVTYLPPKALQVVIRPQS